MIFIQLHVVFLLYQDFPSVAVVGLGQKGAGVCGKEHWDNSKENIRAAVAGTCLYLLHNSIQWNLGLRE